MEKTVQKATVPEAEGVTRFNFHKLQAVLCIASSAVVSIGLIAWFISFVN